MVARRLRLHVWRDRVDVGGLRAERQVAAAAPRDIDQFLEQEVRALRSFVLEHALERFDPVLRLGGIGVGRRAGVHLRQIHWGDLG